ncbi:MAG: PQQ-binding-like beta-propeller repeat protein [Candidatus Coatesbacteria bacterium]|nr:PQQ-binding-like beta-propeller repeat protein [Candidatus Coatesbacteria bacterium]
MKKWILLFIIFCNLGILFSAPGELVWRYRTNGDIESSPVVSNNIVYFGSNDRNFYALNAQNGNRIWSIQIGTAILSRPFVKDGIVYYAGSGPLFIVRAHNANSGTMIWEYETTGNNYSSPVVSNGILYVGSNDKYLYALNASNGSLKWKYLSEAEVGSPCIWETQGLVFFGIRKHTEEMKSLYALDALTGRFSWSYDTRSYVYDPFFSNGNIFSASTSYGVFANNATNGSLIWSSYFGYPKYIFSNPVVSDGLVIFGCDDNIVHALDEKTGVQKWFYNTGSDIHSDPFVKDKVVYINSLNQYLYALDIKDGSLKWQYRVGIINESSPYVSNSIVYIGCSDDYLYAIETYGYTGFTDYKSATKLPEKDFSASPNPFSSRLSLSLPSSASIYSLTGQLIIKLDKGKHSLDTSKWREGVYIVKNGDETKRIVKVN